MVGRERVGERHRRYIRDEIVWVGREGGGETLQTRKSECEGVEGDGGEGKHIDVTLKTRMFGWGGSGEWGVGERHTHVTLERERKFGWEGGGGRERYMHITLDTQRVWVGRGWGRQIDVTLETRKSVVVLLLFLFVFGEVDGDIHRCYIRDKSLGGEGVGGRRDIGVTLETRVCVWVGGRGHRCYIRDESGGRERH